jgi:hypothetical protein
MKSLAYVLLAVSAVAAWPFGQEGAQQHAFDNLQTYPGFSLDLTERRLVQLEQNGASYTEWMTELDKAGRSFLFSTIGLILWSRLSSSLLVSSSWTCE